MRYALLLLAACSPDIASGVYLCGAEQTCPNGMLCDAETTTCVNSDTATTFSCVAAKGTQAAPLQLGQVTCGVNTIEDQSCLVENGDIWYAFTVQTGCNVSVDALFKVESSYAFAPLTLELRDATGATVLGSATAGCPNVKTPDKTGQYAYCLSQTLTMGMSYTLHVLPTGEANCGGECNYNNYRLDITQSP